MTTLHDIQSAVHVGKDKVKPANGALRMWINDNSNYKGDDCLVWPFSLHSATGYPGNTAWGGKQMFGHRAMCICAHGDAPTNKHHAAHSCGNRWCINPNHLRWATPSQNQMDRVKHGTSNRGDFHGQSKLVPSDVLSIHTSDKDASYLSNKFGVSVRTISDIRNGSTWGWLTGEVK